MSLAGTWLLPAIDASIATAYLTMVFAVLRFMRMRRGAPLNRVYALLAAAIGMAGVAHAALFWSAMERGAGASLTARALEAIAAVATAAILLILLPRSVDPPGRAALLRSKAALERAEALVHFGSWQWDPIADRVEWSPELHRIYGLRPGAFEGTLHGYLSRVHPDDRDRISATVRDAFESKRAFAMRERIVRPDGEIRHLESAGDVVLDAQGNVTGMFGACHDITEHEYSEARRRETERQRQALEQQFIQAQKLEAVGRLAGGIAHDFNNMLLVISGSASLLMADKNDADPQWADLKAIDDAAERASGLTRQLLAVARRQVFTIVNVDLNAVVREMEDMLRRSLNDDIRFVLQLSDKPLVVRADVGQLHQVLLNLAVNARDAMPQGGTLTLTTRLARDRENRELACVDVADTGIGMDTETLEHTFEPFFTTKGHAGTGLGLATVYGIVSQSGGWVDVASEPGRGTTFSVCLPRIEAQAEAAGAAEVERAVGGSETVLVVDDSEPVLALTSRILDRAGYRVLTAPSGHWALSVAERHTDRIDLLLTDVVMPGMSGRQLADQISALRPGLRVVFMSGYQRTSDGASSVLPERARLLEKPFKPDHLLRTVRSALDTGADRDPLGNRK